MRHPTIYSFLKWAGPTVVIFLGSCVGLVGSLAPSFPRLQTWAEHSFDRWWPVVSAPAFLVAGALTICAYIAALVYTGSPRPVPKTGLLATRPMSRSERRADEALRKRLKEVSPAEGLRLVKLEGERFRRGRSSPRYRALRRMDDWFGTHLADALEEADADRKAYFEEMVSDRMIPFVALRDIAQEYGVDLPSVGPAQNNSYYLEGALRQAAVRGELAVEGRQHRGPVRSNDPLVPIPAEHFREYEFGHGNLHYRTANDQTRTNTIQMLARGQDGVEGVTFYDLHLSELGARKVLRQFAETAAANGGAFPHPQLTRQQQQLDGMTNGLGEVTAKLDEAVFTPFREQMRRIVEDKDG